MRNLELPAAVTDLSAAGFPPEALFAALDGIDLPIDGGPHRVRVRVLGIHPGPAHCWVQMIMEEIPARLLTLDLAGPPDDGQSFVSLLEPRV
jgi:hypothetical protein